MPNTLFYGDNLNMLRERVPGASVDLVYLDPRPGRAGVKISVIK